MKTVNELKLIFHYLIKIGHSKQTAKLYLWGIGNYLIANPNAEKYRFKDILFYLSKKMDDASTPETNMNLLPPIKKYYHYLLDTGRRKDHPCRRLMLKSKRAKEFIYQDLFTSYELDLLMYREERYELLKTKNRVIISLLIYQGLTAGEMVSLKTICINFDKGSIFVKESRMNSRRHLEMKFHQQDLFYEYIFMTRKKMLKVNTEALLIGKLGTPITVDDINYLVSTFKPMFPERNLNAKTVRQSVIANWINEKHIPVEMVQLMAGHRCISTTIKYRFNSVEEERELINRFHPMK